MKTAARNRFRRITPFLWFDNQAEEAARFYTRIFKRSRILRTTHYTPSTAKVAGRKAGSVMTVVFQLEGQEFVALNGGPLFEFTEAVSFVVNCRTQAEIDYFWSGLSEGGEPGRCGWLKDRFGVSWQVVPEIMDRWIGGGNGAQADRVMKAMLQMDKLELRGPESSVCPGLKSGALIPPVREIEPKTASTPEHPNPPRAGKWRVWIALLLLVHAAIPLDAAEQMTFLDNGEVRIGMDLSLGGAVTYLSSRERPANLINSADLGRQIQMSHYSGPWPFEPDGRKPDPAWAGLGWNPIQTGDCKGNPSQVLEHRNNGHELYIRCIPMQWPLNNVPGDCVFETWTTLEGPVVHMHFRCTNHRADSTAYRASPQELPAVYTVSTLWRLMSYTGDRPFTGAGLTHVTNNWRAPWPWTRFTATEHWVALVGDDGWGLGVFKDDATEFHGGIHGEGRSSNPKAGSTAYVAPIHRENFDHNIVYDHETTLMVGRLEDLRKRFNGLAKKTPPDWLFTTNRQHWTLHNAQDEGFPLQGEWRVIFGNQKPRLEGPAQCWRAEQAGAVVLELRHQGKPSKARLSWKRLGEEHPAATQHVEFDLAPTDAVKEYRIDLSASPEYRGLITGLNFEPIASPQPGGRITIRSIRLVTGR